MSLQKSLNPCNAEHSGWPKIINYTGYYILGAMLTVYPLLALPLSLNYSGLQRYLFLAVLSLLGLYYLIRIKRPPFLFEFYPLIIFLLLAFISSVQARYPVVAIVGSPHRFTGLSTYYFCAILFFLASQVKNVDRLLRAMLYSAASASALALLQYFGLIAIPPFREGAAAYSTMGNPNFFGSYVVLVLPAPLIFYLKTASAKWLLISLSIYLGLLFCLTRGAWLAFVAAFFMVFYTAAKELKAGKKFMFLSVALLLLTLVVLPSKGGIIYKRGLSVSSEIVSAVQLEDGAASGRMFIWKETAKLLPEHWAIGLGPEHLIFEEISGIPGYVADKAHNIFLEIAVTMGVFSMFAYMCFIALLLRPPHKNSDSVMFFIMITAYLIQGFFNIDTIVAMPIFWIIMGFALNARYKNAAGEVTHASP